MFFSHMPEILMLLVGALLLFGPKRLPEIGSSLGQGIREMRNGLRAINEPVVVSNLDES